MKKNRINKILSAILSVSLLTAAIVPGSAITSLAETIPAESVEETMTAEEETELSGEELYADFLLEMSENDVETETDEQIYEEGEESAQETQQDTEAAESAEESASAEQPDTEAVEGAEESASAEQPDTEAVEGAEESVSAEQPDTEEEESAEDSVASLDVEDVPEDSVLELSVEENAELVMVLSDENEFLVSANSIEDSYPVEFGKHSHGFEDENGYLAGATLTVLTKNGQEVTQWVSQNEAEVIYLQEGDYILHEDEAPGGYRVVPDIHFSVYSDGSVELTWVDGLADQNQHDNTVQLNGNRFDVFDPVDVESQWVEVQKIWSDEFSEEEWEPIRVGLFDEEDHLIEEVEISSDVPGYNPWSHFWMGLDLDKEYTVKEFYEEDGKYYPVYGAVTRRIDYDPYLLPETGATVPYMLITSYTITNMKNDPIDIDVRKTWSESFEDAEKSVQVQLLKNGQVYETVTLNEENDWFYQWTDMSPDAEYEIREIIPEGLENVWLPEYTAVKVEGSTVTVEKEYEIDGKSEGRKMTYKDENGNTVVVAPWAVCINAHKPDPYSKKLEYSVRENASDEDVSSLIEDTTFSEDRMMRLKRVVYYYSKTYGDTVKGTTFENFQRVVWHITDGSSLGGALNYWAYDEVKQLARVAYGLKPDANVTLENIEGIQKGTWAPSEDQKYHVSDDVINQTLKITTLETDVTTRKNTGELTTYQNLLYAEIVEPGTVSNGAAIHFGVYNDKKYQNPEGNLSTQVTADEKTSDSEESVILILEGETLVSVVDTIQYTGLAAGEIYTVTGTLYEVNEDGTVDVDSPIAAKTEELEAEAENGIWTMNFGEVALKPDRKYVVFESAVSKNDLVDTDEDNLPDAPHELLHKDPEDKAQTVVTVKKYENPDGNLSTQVTADEKKSDSEESVILILEGETQISVVDTIQYTGLAAGEIYTVTGTLYEVNEDGTVDEDSPIAAKTEDLKAKAESGTWTMNFGEVTLEPDRKYVVFESAVSKNNLVDTDEDNLPDAPQELMHEDPEDKAQTVVTVKKYENPNGELKTQVSANGETSVDTAPVSLSLAEVTQVSVVDKIQYTGLAAGEMYTVTGTLYEVNEDGTVDEDSPIATKTEKLEAKTEDGIWTIDFGEVSLEPGKKYVVFETAESLNDLVDTDEDNLPDAPHVVEHRDPEDQAQTIVTTQKIFATLPETGGRSWTPIFNFGMITTLLSAAVLMFLHGKEKMLIVKKR